MKFAALVTREHPKTDLNDRRARLIQARFWLQFDPAYRNVTSLLAHAMRRHPSHRPENTP